MTNDCTAHFFIKANFNNFLHSFQNWENLLTAHSTVTLKKKKKHY